MRAAGHKLGVRRTHTVSQYSTGGRGRGRGRVYPRFCGVGGFVRSLRCVLEGEAVRFPFPILGTLFGETPLDRFSS